jgi:hypothetical protein
VSKNRVLRRIFLDPSVRRLKKIAGAVPYFILYIELFCCVFQLCTLLKLLKESSRESDGQSM